MVSGRDGALSSRAGGLNGPASARLAPRLHDTADARGADRRRGTAVAGADRAESAIVASEPYAAVASAPSQAAAVTRQAYDLLLDNFVIPPPPSSLLSRLPPRSDSARVTSSQANGPGRPSRRARLVTMPGRRSRPGWTRWQCCCRLSSTEPHSTTSPFAPSWQRSRSITRGTSTHARTRSTRRGGGARYGTRGSARACVDRRQWSLKYLTEAQRRWPASEPETESSRLTACR